MRKSTLLISRKLFDQYPFLAAMSGNDFRELLSFLLKDPHLMKKMKLLKSYQYTKIYQETGMDLVSVKFYPLPEDWCHLSILSNGSGFSRCYVFVYLLEYYLGKRKLKFSATAPENSDLSHTDGAFCIVSVDKIRLRLHRYHHTAKPFTPEQKKPTRRPLE